MPKRNSDARKREALRAHGSLNPHPEAVTSALFQNSTFFDPADLVQVKYEMLRRAEAENQPVSRAAREFGFSRPSFYQAQTAFQQSGLSGLIPQKRGPREAHKLTDAVMEFVEHADDRPEQISIARCRELLGEEAASMTAQEIDLIRRHAEMMAGIVIEMCQEGPRISE